MNAILTDRYDSLHQAVTEAIQSLQLNPTITANPFLLGDVLMRLNKELAHIIEQHPRFVAWADGHLDKGNYAFKVWIADSLFQEKITQSFEFKRDGKHTEEVKLPVIPDEDILKAQDTPITIDGLATSLIEAAMQALDEVSATPLTAHKTNARKAYTSKRKNKRHHTYKRILTMKEKTGRSIKFGQVMHQYFPVFKLSRLYTVLGGSFDRDVFEVVTPPEYKANIQLRLKAEYTKTVVDEQYTNFDLSTLLIDEHDALAEKLLEFNSEDAVAIIPHIHENEFILRNGKRDTYRLSALGKLMFRIFNGTEPEENYAFGLLKGERPVFKFTATEDKEVAEEPVKEDDSEAIPEGEISSSPASEIEVAPTTEEPIQEEVEEQIEEAPVELEHICYFCKKWNGGRNKGTEKQIAAPCPIKGRKTLTDDTCGKFVQVICK